MTSAAIELARSAGGRYGEGRWMIIFAAVLPVVVGFSNLIDGIAAIANSHIFNANAHYVIGDLRAPGLGHPHLPDWPIQVQPLRERIGSLVGGFGILKCRRPRPRVFLIVERAEWPIAGKLKPVFEKV
jgi:hypothetical protein